MTGGGFGGAVVIAAAAARGRETALAVSAEYARRSGLQPDVLLP
jgi:galactokinase